MLSRPAMQGPDKKGLTAPCKVLFFWIGGTAITRYQLAVRMQFVCSNLQRR